MFDEVSKERIIKGHSEGEESKSELYRQAHGRGTTAYLHRVAIMGSCPNVNKPKLIYFLFMTLIPNG